MDPTLNLEAKRLFVSTALTTHAARSLRGFVSADSGEDRLLLAARHLVEEADSIGGQYGLVFDPPYPGVSAGVESLGGGLRLVFACKVLDTERHPLGVAFTSLIPGRRPQVSVAPRVAGIPGGWRPLDELC